MEIDQHNIAKISDYSSEFVAQLLRALQSPSPDRWEGMKDFGFKWIAYYPNGITTKGPISIGHRRAPDRKDLKAEFVRSILDYDAENGIFTWKVRALDTFAPEKQTLLVRRASAWNKRYAGKIAGTKTFKDVGIIINRTRYLAHRLAWLWMTGEWPTYEIDHRDRDKLNNKWANLREATQGENARNIGLTIANKTGFKGVSFNRKRRKFTASIRVNGERITLGAFDTAAASSAAWRSAALKHHQEFAYLEDSR